MSYISSQDNKQDNKQVKRGDLHGYLCHLVKPSQNGNDLRPGCLGLKFKSLPYLPHLVKNLRLRVLLHKPGDLIHQAVRHRVVGHDRRHPDHRDLVNILLVDLRRRDMEPVLQLRDDTFNDHSLFFEAVHPRCVEPECHYCNVHTFLQRVCWAALASPLILE